jgi:hypothetical protein
MMLWLNSGALLMSLEMSVLGIPSGFVRPFHKFRYSTQTYFYLYLLICPMVVGNVHRFIRVGHHPGSNSSASPS